MRVLMMCLAINALRLSAQIQDLATTDDGRTLYFSSTLRLKGADEYDNAKIFQFTRDRYGLAAQTTPVISTPNGTVVHYDLHFPNSSGDGMVVAYDRTDSCTRVTSNCQENFADTQTTTGFVSGSEIPPEMFGGSLRVSRNGRYFIEFCCIGQGDPSPGPSEFYDSQTGTLTTIPGYKPVGDGRQSITDDGTVMLTTWAGSPALYFWKNGALQKLTLEGNIYNSFGDSPRLSADGSAIVYRGTDPKTGKAQLLVFNVKTDGQSILATGPPTVTFPGPGGICSCPILLGAYFRPSISNDAQTVLFRAADPVNGFSTKSTQVFVWNANGTKLRQLTTETSGIAESVLSGDGHTAYAVTLNGHLLSIDVDSGSVQRLLGDLPSFDANAIVPGSRAVVKGQRLTTSDGQSLVHFAEFQGPVLSASSNQVVIQVPWELDLNRPVTLVASAAVSPFELAHIYQPLLAAPLFLNVLHTDFRGTPTDRDPAQPGEILVLQMTGLGPVSPAPPTGTPAPDNPLSYSQLPLSCRWLSPNVDAPVLFAGLAPEFIGMYQVNVLVSQDALAGQQLRGTYLQCSVGAYSALSDYLYIGNAQ